MSSFLRIIQVVNVRWYNATAWYALSLSRLLADAGHRVKVLALAGTEPFEKARRMGLDTQAAALNSVNPAHLLRESRHLRHLTSAFRPQVVNCHRGEGMLLWGQMKLLDNSFALVRTRGDQRSPRKNMFNRYLYSRLCDAVITTNSRTQAQCREFFALDEAGLFMIPGGVDRKRFAFNPQARVELRRRYGIAEDDVTLGLVGRFDPVKGHKELFDAIALIRDGLRRLTPGGPGPFRLMLIGFPANISLERMRGMLRERGLEERTIITGKVDNVAEHISCLDLAVAPSQGSEAIARAALELMSCGIPLIGTDVGVMPDLLAPEALVPAADPQALAALLFRALTGADFRHGLREEQAAAMPRFSQEHFLEQTLAAYEQAMRRNLA
jgi:glycosyltransferase involved in cell wall biosynthesis